MKAPDALRALAQDLRSEAVRRDGVRRDKAAAALVAAAGLGMLRRKLGVPRG